MAKKRKTELDIDIVPEEEKAGEVKKAEEGHAEEGVKEPVSKKKLIIIISSVVAAALIITVVIFFTSKKPDKKEESVKKLIEWCHHGPPGAVVKNLKIEWQAYEGEFKNFTVIRGL